MTATAFATKQDARERQEVEIVRSLSLLTEPGRVFELRVPKVDGRDNRTAAGYFNDPEALARTAAQWAGRAAGIYITLNPVNPDLLARASNRAKDWSKLTTSDADIIRRRNLLIDADPVRAAGISSTDQEHDIALARALAVQSWLTDQGWPQPLYADSGNGGHLVYAVDLPNDKDAALLVQRCLQAIDAEWGDAAVAIDTSVYNASRISKLYGTPACKGDDVPERPHRMSRILDAPDALEPVSVDLLRDLALLEPDANDPQPQRGAYTGGEFDIEGFIALHSDRLHPSPPKTLSNGTTRWRVDCIHNDDHRGDAVIGRRTTGALWAKCSHNSCQGRWGWKELRALLEPKTVHTNGKGPQAETAGRGKQRKATTGDATTATQDDTSILLDLPTHDHGNAQAVNCLYTGRFAYCPALGWLAYSGHYWRMEAAEFAVNSAITDTLSRRRHAAVDAQREQVVKETKPSAARKAAVRDMFRDLVIADLAEFDADPDVLNTPSGVVDLRTGQLVTGEASGRFTYCIPTPYDPAAVSELWLTFLANTVDHYEAIGNWLQMAAGYSITGRTNEEIMFYDHGPARSGKGTYSQTQLAMLGTPLSRGVDFATFTKRREGDSQNFDLAPLRAARLICASESGRYQTLNEAVVKQITGGDPVSAAFKHRDMFSFTPAFKVWLFSNHPARGDSDDDAFWGRLKVISFPNSHLGSEDKSLKWRMQEPDNLRGVLAWAVEGARRWYAAGPAGLVTPWAVEQATQDHRAQLDTVGQWMQECATPDPAATTPNARLYESYQGWCNENGHEPKKATAFGRALVAKGFERGTVYYGSSTVRGYKGLRLNDRPLS